MQVKVNYDTFINGKEYKKNDVLEINNAPLLIKLNVVKEFKQVLPIEVAPREESLEKNMIKRKK
jgi:hypothetical protein